jgi:hypothetical protein
LLPIVDTIEVVLAACRNVVEIGETNTAFELWRRPLRRAGEMGPEQHQVPDV